MQLTIRLFVMFSLATASVTWGQETLLDRFEALDRNEAAIRANAKRSLEHKSVSSAKNHERSAVTLNCSDPRMVATRDGLVRMLCDVNDDGVADAMAVFYQLPADAGNFISALAPNGRGNILFAATDTGTFVALTDSNKNGLADPQMTRENPGLAYTERLIPHFDNTVLSVYAENSETGRFNLYFLRPQETLVQGSDPTRGARRVAGSVGVQNVGVYFIDPTENTVRRMSYNGVGYLQNDSSRNDVLYRGSRVASISVDWASSLLFVLEAGTCGDVMPQPTSLPGTPNQLPSVCSVPGFRILKINGNTTIDLGFVSDPKLNTVYGFTGHSMVARGGKLHVAVYPTPLYERRSSGQQILEFRYNQATGKVNGPATVFADYQLLGDNPFVGAMTTFDGGPVSLPQ